MNKFKKLGVLAVIASFLSAGNVFAQNQVFFPVGNDFMNPIIDPFLLEHAWYGDSDISGSGWGFTLPVSGFTGTAGSFGLGGTITLAGSDACTQEAGDGQYFLQNIVNTGNINVGSRGRLFWGSNSSGRPISGPNTQRNSVYSQAPSRILGGQTITGKPRFPQVNWNALSSAHPSQGALSLNNGGTRTLNGNTVHHFSSILLGGNAVLSIRPGTTIIYVSGNITDNGSNNQIRFVRANNTPVNANDLCDEDVAALWNVMFIVGGDVTLNSGGSRVMGTFIAPNGSISTGSGQIFYDGQILANELSFTNSYNSAVNMRFIPFRVQNIDAEFGTIPSFVKNWECTRIESGVINVPVNLSEDLPDGVSISVTYTLGGWSGLAQGDIIPNTGVLQFTGGPNSPSRRSANIPLRIVNDANTRTGTFVITLSNASANPADGFDASAINGVSSGPITVSLGRGEQHAPSNITLSQSPNRPVEFHNNSPTLQNSGAQIVGFLSATSLSNPVSRWEIVPNIGNYSWFNVANNGMVTTNAAFRADFENSAQRTATIRVRAVAEQNSDCARESEQNLNINIFPWNDNIFNTRNLTGNYSLTVNAGQTVQIDSLSWFIGDSDASLSGNQNRALIRGIALTAGAQGWNANSNINANTAISPINAGGATVSVNGNTVVFNSAGTDRNTPNPIKFFILARDSAAYGFTVDHFDRWIEVNVNVNHPPLPQIFSINRCNNSDTTISVSQLLSAANITAGHTLVSASSALNRASVVGQNLLYNLSPSVAATSDIITYTVRNTVSNLEGTGSINVNILPIRENRPIAADRVVQGLFIGIPTDINVSADWSDANTGAANLRITHGSVSNITPADMGITVDIAGPGVFRVFIPREVYGSPTVSFTYTITDDRNFSVCDQFNTASNVSLPATVTVETQRPDGWMVIPHGDTIIVEEGVAATALWNGGLSVMDNDEMSEDGYRPGSVRIGVLPRRGTLELNSDGTFIYTHDGGEHGPNPSDWTDEFTYYLSNDLSPANETPHPATVIIFINPINDNAPVLAPRTATLQAREGREFHLVTNALDRVYDDADEDWATTLKLYNNPDDLVVLVNGNAAEVGETDIEIRSDSTVFFRYNRDITQETQVIVHFSVNDGVNYVHIFNADESGLPENAVWAQRIYENFHESAPHANTLTLSVLPNPSAQNFEMRLRESEASSTLFIGEDSYQNLRGSLNLPAGRWSFELKDSTLNGRLEFNENTGVINYLHENEIWPEGFTDYFTYYLIILLPDGTEIRSEGRVDISVWQREPYILENGVFYEDTDADGQVDRLTVAFDREVNLLQIGFTVIFNSDILEIGRLRHLVSEGDTNRTVVVIPLIDVAKNITGGTMTVGVTHDEEIFPGAQAQSVNAADKAAPVVNAAVLIRALSPGESDTLVLEMSEPSQISIGGGNTPFLFVRGDSIFSLSYAHRITGENNRHKLILNPRYNGSILEGDSVFINYIEGEREDSLPDGALEDGIVRDFPDLNQQTNPQNRRVEIAARVVTQIISATYFDMGSVRADGTSALERDGFIDRISFDLGMTVSMELATEIAAALYLPDSRAFSKGAITLTDRGFDLAVTEAASLSSPRGLPRTSVDINDDLIKLPEEIVYNGGLITVDASSVLPSDSVAPVILRAYYRFSSESLDTTLEVIFSEPVELTGNGVPSPYMFWSINHGAQYQMRFVNTAPSAGQRGGREYTVDSVSILFPISGDSIWISDGGHIADILGNEARLSVRAPLFLDGRYSDHIEVFIVPQPLRLINIGSGRAQAATLHEGLIARYRLPLNMHKGTAIILEARGPISRPELQSGFVRIIDNIGNVVRENIEIEFALISDGERVGNVVGRAVWDGKNESGRTVGAAAYLAIIQLGIKFDDREIPEPRILRRVISVSTATGE